MDGRTRSSSNNEDAIVEALGGMAEQVAVHYRDRTLPRRRRSTTSQSAATPTMIPLGLALGISAGYMIAMWTAVDGVLVLPANGTQIAAAEADETGTTTLGKRVIDHSFQLPLQVCWIVTASSASSSSGSSSATRRRAAGAATPTP